MRLHSDKGHGAPWCIWQLLLSRRWAQLPSWTAVSSGGPMAAYQRETQTHCQWSSVASGGARALTGIPCLQHDSPLPLHAPPSLGLFKYSENALLPLIVVTWLTYHLWSTEFCILSLSLCRSQSICKHKNHPDLREGNLLTILRSLEDVHLWHKWDVHVKNSTKSSWNQVVWTKTKTTDRMEKKWRKNFKTGPISSQRGSRYSWHWQEPVEHIRYRISDTKVENLLPVCDALRGERETNVVLRQLWSWRCHLVILCSGNLRAETP